MDRAEAVMDKKEMKVEKSKGRARTVQERAKGWEDLNKKILAKQAAPEALEKENWQDEDEMEEDAEVEGDAQIEVEDTPVADPMATEIDHQSIPLPGAAEDEEEEL